jgi:hypothetical protein
MRKSTLFLATLLLLATSHCSSLNYEEKTSAILRSSDKLYALITQIPSKIDDLYFDFVSMESPNWKGAYYRSLKPNQIIKDQAGCPQTTKGQPKLYETFSFINEKTSKNSQGQLVYSGHACFGWWIGMVYYTAGADFKIVDKLLSSDLGKFGITCEENKMNSFDKCLVSETAGKVNGKKDLEALVGHEVRGWVFRQFINNVVSENPWSGW